MRTFAYSNETLQSLLFIDRLKAAPLVPLACEMANAQHFTSHILAHIKRFRGLSLWCYCSSD